MSQALSMPQHLGQIEPPKDYHYDGRIPRLRDLLPQFQGQPGFVYAQVCVQNLRRAQDEGWGEVASTAIYTIRGPLGEAHMKLFAVGKSVPGQSHQSGRRICLVDKDVQAITGLEIQPVQVEVAESGGQQQSTEGDASGGEEEKQTSSGVSAEQRESTKQAPAGKAKG